MNYKEVITELKSHANRKNAAGMARFGINPKGTLGVSIPLLRQMAKRIGMNHPLALKLWDSGIHEARLLAGFIADPTLITRREINQWVTGFDSWDICDQVISNLLDRTTYAYEMALKWPHDRREYVKRAGFVMMAALAVHDKNAPDERFTQFFPLIKRQATDERNFVKKAVNWALRQIGKRNLALNKLALDVAREISNIDSISARWIAKDAIRELAGKTAQKKVRPATAASD